jgi:Transposase and inactivated derivatives
MRYMTYLNNMNADNLIAFMKRLTKGTTNKIFLILDNLRVHHSKKVKEWVEKNSAKIKLFFLPPYAPEYNPGEYLNSDLKRGVGNRPMPKIEKDIIYNIHSHLKKVQLRPWKIIAFFKTKFTRYAKQ